MSIGGLPTIRELVAEGAATLPEPFSRAALINWVSARRPDVGVSSIATHIQFATANAAHTGNEPFSGREPLLQRVGRGQYVRYRAESGEPSRVPAGTPRARVAAARRVVLVGSTGELASEPMPIAHLFQSAGFSRVREYVGHSQLPWFVLSAKHGLLDPDDVVGPYDLQLADRSTGYRTAWGEWVVAQLSDRVPLAGVTVEVHGGVDFAQPLRRPLMRRGAGLELALPGTWQEPSGLEHEDEPHDDPHDSPVRTALDRLRGLVSPHRSANAEEHGRGGGGLGASAS
jgi:hypothetical protein